jgi:predicted RNA-binding Zn ribbon-like protein
MAPEMKPRSFRLLGGPLALELANTVVARSANGIDDRLADPNDAVEWLIAEGLTPPDDPEGAFAELISLRNAVRETAEALIAGRRPSATSLHLLNEVAAQPATTPILRYRQGRLDLLEYESGTPLDVAVARIARDAVRLFGGPLGSRIKQCQGPGCLMLFVADNPRRQWCSPQLCGNRVRVARHYKRSRAAVRSLPDSGHRR